MEGSQADGVDSIRARSLLEGEQRRLMRWRDELVAEHDEMEREGAGELSTIDQHLADLASDTAERDRVTSMLVTVDDALGEVETALQRLASGRYGQCASCGVPIPDARLEAVPATRFCKEHQGYWEGSRLLMNPPDSPVGDEPNVEIEALMLHRWGGRASGLPSDDLLGDGATDVPLEDMEAEAALQEEREHRE